MLDLSEMGLLETSLNSPVTARNMPVCVKKEGLKPLEIDVTLELNSLIA